MTNLRIADDQLARSIQEKGLKSTLAEYQPDRVLTCLVWGPVALGFLVGFLMWPLSEGSVTLTKAINLGVLFAGCFMGLAIFFTSWLCCQEMIPKRYHGFDVYEAYLIYNIRGFDIVCHLQQDHVIDGSDDRLLSFQIAHTFKDAALPEGKTRAICMPLGGWFPSKGAVKTLNHLELVDRRKTRIDLLWVSDRIIKTRYRDERGCKAELTLTEAIQLAEAKEFAEPRADLYDISTFVSHALASVTKKKEQSSAAS